MLTKRFSGLVSLLAVVVVMLSACTGEQVPGWEFMPDMYRTPSIKAYEPHEIFPDSMSAMVPPKGTIPRGFMHYPSFDAGNEGYEAAKANLSLPAGFPTDSIALADGAKLYGIYCSACHGEKGDGQGILVQREKFLGIPSYADRQINMGSIFHVVTYGRNLMGSHAAQVTPEERWKIAQHVMKLRAELTGGGEDAATAGTDTTAAATEGAAEINQDNNQG